MKENKRKIKKEKGAIAIFVLIALLFMSAFLILSYGNNLNKEKTVKEQFSILEDIYSFSGGETGAYEKAYTDLREKNKQTLTASVENASSLEVTKAYADKLGNFRIYGNSIQNGTPTPDNPVKIESVGKSPNLFNNILPYKSLDNDNKITSKEDLETGLAAGQMIFIGVQCVSSSLKYSINNTIYFFIKIENGKTYTQNQYRKGNLTLLDGDFNILKQANSNIITNDVNAKYLTAYVSNIAQTSTQQAWTTQDVLDNLQVEEDSSSTEYVPYGKYKIPVRITTGKNLVNLPDGKYQLADSIGFTTKYDVAKTKKIIDLGNISSLAGKTVTLSVGDWTGTYLNGNVADPRIKINIYNKDGNVISQKLLITPTPTVFPATATFTLENNAYYAIISTGTGSTINVTVKDFMIEEGDKATTFEPYKGQSFNIILDQPLRKIGDFADYIDFKTGKVVRKVEVINETGTVPLQDSLQALETPTEESVSLPELSTYEDYNKLEVLTDIVPSKVELEYTGYTLD